MRQPADKRELKIVEDGINLFNQCAAFRYTHNSHWDETAAILAPNFRNTFYRESYNFPGIKKTQNQVDASGMVANAKFAAICDSMITPFSSKWHNLEAADPYLQKQRQIRLWMEQATHTLFQLRYMAQANFRKQNQAAYYMVGAFGNGPLFIQQLHDMLGNPVKGFSYAALPLGDIYIRVNFQNKVDSFVRIMHMTARQAVQKWGEDMLPEEYREAYTKNSETLYEFFHCVWPNTDYDPRAVFHPVMGKPFVSYYIATAARRVMQEGGYRTFPLSFARYTQAPGEIYGRGWAQDVLPALKTLNAEKATFLKAGHRAADPVLLTTDDGVTDFSLVPGALNKGGVNQDGKQLVQALEPGNIQITKEMMDEERGLIGEMSLTTIFQSLVENPNMTATQVIELINQKGIFLAPNVGGMASDYVEPIIEREVDLAVGMGLLPPMPPLLAEAYRSGAKLKIVHTSPLFKAARAGEASGFLRTVESAMQIAGQTGDPSVLDAFDFDVAFPEIARIQDVPESWMASPDKIAARRQARAQSQDKQDQINALPAQAAMLKALKMTNTRSGNPMPPGVGQPQAA